MKEAAYLQALRHEVTRVRFEPIQPHQETARLRQGAISGLEQELDEARAKRMDAIFVHLAKMRTVTDRREKEASQAIYLGGGMAAILAIMMGDNIGHATEPLLMGQFANATLAAIKHRITAGIAYSRIRDLLQEEAQTIPAQTD